MNVNHNSETQKNDEHFADNATDADPRTPQTSRTGVGAYDINADNATVPADVPAVRSGDEDSPHAPSTPPSINVDLGADITDAKSVANDG